MILLPIATKLRKKTDRRQVNIMARYSMEFKKNAVSLFKSEGITKTCRKLHVTRATVYRWVKQDESKCIKYSKDERGIMQIAKNEK